MKQPPPKPTKRQRWLTDEDQKLKELIEKHGGKNGKPLQRKWIVVVLHNAVNVGQVCQTQIKSNVRGAKKKTLI